MKSFNSKIFIESKERLEFTDITSKVKEIVEESGVNNGVVVVYSTHTTTCVKINENEPRLIDDFKTAGYYSISWKADNLPSGIYFYRIDAGAFKATEKMLLLK